MKDFKDVVDGFARLILSLKSKEEVVESAVFVFDKAGKFKAELQRIKDVISQDLTAVMKIKIISEIIDIDD